MYTPPLIPLLNKLDTCACDSEPKEIKTPSWVEQRAGYLLSTYLVPYRRLEFVRANMILAKYVPTMATGDDGFVMLYVLDGDDGGVYEPDMDKAWTLSPWSGMKNLWRETAKTTDKMKEDGRIVNASLYDIGILSVSMLRMYAKWKDHPNETEFWMVEKIESAIRDVRNMQVEVAKGYLKNEIMERRAEIESIKEQISTCEAQMNEVYERAANALNFLEAHGIRMDVNEFANG